MLKKSTTQEFESNYLTVKHKQPIYCSAYKPRILRSVSIKLAYSFVFNIKNNYWVDKIPYRNHDSWFRKPNYKTFELVGCFKIVFSKRIECFIIEFACRFFSNLFEFSWIFPISSRFFIGKLFCAARCTHVVPTKRFLVKFHFYAG